MRGDACKATSRVKARSWTYEADAHFCGRVLNDGAVDDHQVSIVVDTTSAIARPPSLDDEPDQSDVCALNNGEHRTRVSTASTRVENRICADY